MSEACERVSVKGQARLSTTDLHALVEDLLVVESPVDDAETVDQIEALERIKSATCALQAQLTDKLATSRPTQAGHPAASVASEIALARHESPYAGRRKTRLAAALIHDLPHTYAALCAGDLNEHRAHIIADETADLSREDRLAADEAIAPVFDGPHGCTLGDKKLTHRIRGIVYQLDDQGATARHDKALANRRVTGRLLRNGTAEIKIITTAGHCAAIMNSLDNHAATRRAAGDERPKNHIIADEAATRLAKDTTEQDDSESPESGVPVAVQLVISAETLFGGESDPARLPGHGPIPATIARRMVAHSHPIRSALRRLFAVPADGSLITMESTQRRFPPPLRAFLRLRDDLCRTPWCNAPIRHADHTHPASRGGPTTTLNGQGLCEWCNYVKDQPGWTHQPGPRDQAHTVETTTPTGHRHRSREPGTPTPKNPRYATRAEIMIRDYIELIA